MRHREAHYSLPCARCAKTVRILSEALASRVSEKFVAMIREEREDRNKKKKSWERSGEGSISQKSGCNARLAKCACKRPAAQSTGPARARPQKMRRSARRPFSPFLPHILLFSFWEQRGILGSPRCPPPRRTSFEDAARAVRCTVIPYCVRVGAKTSVRPSAAM